MATKKHARSPDKKGFSIALPKSLVAKIESIAKKEKRNRNNTIEWLLDDAVAHYVEDKRLNVLSAIQDSPSQTKKKAE